MAFGPLVFIAHDFGEWLEIPVELARRLPVETEITGKQGAPIHFPAGLRYADNKRTRAPHPVRLSKNFPAKSEWLNITTHARSSIKWGMCPKIRSDMDCLVYAAMCGRGATILIIVDSTCLSSIYSEIPAAHFVCLVLFRARMTRRHYRSMSS